jgi:hypothetical protein
MGVGGLASLYHHAAALSVTIHHHLYSALGGTTGTAGHSDEMDDGEALRQRLRNIREKINASGTTRRVSRRSEVFMREPATGFDPSWSEEEAWANGYVGSEHRRP